ncbi:uncharacterized protein N0V89_005327 [Didymosphaeria variabile]|uniref:Uncharacterized protein n=1 Tax=Didymosphaeria variabile TaxID=1932322 RepID=A0A9W8XNB1_9PLEO|nr:uncharacterized protein N0V89_005327 [Didymosphaeria variabile]KAJ4353597.1 hypothetical protein N0V89_005327 [Didymosphaeria variabile]
MVDASDMEDRVPTKPFVGFGVGTHNSLEELAMELQELRRGDTGRRSNSGSKEWSIPLRGDSKNTLRVGIPLKQPLSIADAMPAFKSNRLSLAQPTSIRPPIETFDSSAPVAPSTASTPLQLSLAYQDWPTPAHRSPFFQTSFYMAPPPLLLSQPKANITQPSKTRAVAGAHVEKPGSLRASTRGNPRAPSSFSQAHLAYLKAHSPTWALPARATSGVDQELESNCTPPNVNITLCKMPLSVEEILTYFPLHLKWYSIAARLHSHGWAAMAICYYIYWSRELEQKLTLERTRVQHMLGRALEHYKEMDLALLDPNAISANPSQMKSTATAALAPTRFHDYYLADLAEGVKHHPEGRGRQGLTHAIEHARANGNDTVLLSQAHDYVVKHNLLDVTAEYDCNAEDRLAHPRVYTKTSAYFNKLVDVSGASSGEPKTKDIKVEVIDLTGTDEDDELNAETSEEIHANEKLPKLSNSEKAGSSVKVDAETGKGQRQV